MSKGLQPRLATLASALALLISPLSSGVLLALSPEKTITQYSQDIWTSENGLPQNAIYVIAQTRDGYLWLGTEEGLVRFDGLGFTIFDKRNTDEIKHNYVSALYEDKEGSLWIGTGSGLNRFNDGKFTSFTTKDGLSNNFVLSICEDKEGRLWIGTQGGLNIFKDGKFTTLTTKEGLSNDVVRSIYEDREASLWIGTQGGGLNRFKDGKFTSFTTKEGLSNDVVLSIYEDKEGSLWIGTGGGLNRFKDGKFTTFTTKEGLSNDVVLSIYEDKEGNLWIGTLAGLSRFKDGKFTTFTTKEGLSNDVVLSIYEGKGGSLWIGTQGGLNGFKDGKFTTFTTKEGLSSNAVLSIYEDKEGSLWIGTGGGLNRFKDGKFTTFTTKEGLSNDVVKTIYEDKEGSLWIGTQGGLNRFKDGKFTTFTTTKAGLSEDFVLSIYEDKEGTLWIGTLGGGLNRFKDGKFTVFTAKQGLFDDTAFQILEDDNDNLWMSSNKGIYRISKKNLLNFTDGSVGSLTSVNYGITDGMKTNECNSGFPAGWRTRDGKLWFATIKGLAVIDPNNIRLNSLRPAIVIEKVILDRTDVNPREELAAPPGAGEVEVAFTALSFLVPQKVRFRYKLEGFDGDWIDAGARRTAHYTNLPPGPYRFRVIACNNDGVWNETGATFEFYLQPHFYQTRWFYALCALSVILAGFGLYRLRVRRLRRRTQELEVTVYQRTSELRLEQQKVLKLEKQATEQLMAGGFAHEMRNALAGSKLILDQALALDGPEPHVSLNLANCRSLKAMYLGLKDELPENKTQVVLGQMQTIFANEERVEEVMQLVRKATSRGLNITQQIMDYSKMGQQQPGQHRVDLHNLIVSIVDESREEFSSQGVVIEYKSEPQVLSLIGDETHFYSILKNVILNARDALIDPSLKDRKDRRIEITTALEGSTCSVVIADNGIGIPPENLEKVFEAFFSTKPATGTGLGLGMVMKMVSLYNGQIEVSSEAGKGTSVTISLPVSWQGATL